MVHLRHSYGQLREIDRDLGFDATGFLCTHSSDDPILLIGFGVLCRAVADCLGHVSLVGVFSVSFHFYI